MVCGQGAIIAVVTGGFEPNSRPIAGLDPFRPMGLCKDRTSTCPLPVAKASSVSEDRPRRVTVDSTWYRKVRKATLVSRIAFHKAEETSQSRGKLAFAVCCSL